MEMRTDFPDEEEKRQDGQDGAGEIGHLESRYFRNVSSNPHADADAYLPRSQVGAGGCAPLAVRCQVNE